MSEFTLRIRRYLPESGEAPFYQEFTVDLEGHRSVLEGILNARAAQDGTIGIRCSCRAAICGSCGVRVNGRPGLACHTHLDEALERSTDGKITVDPMGNMPVIKDLIVDMEEVHWKKMRRVTPWLLPDGPPPEREYIVPHQAMVDVTQSMACIQCGACVSDCLAMEVDPLFVGPAALAKAYRFVGDPRDGQHYERLKDLAEDEHGLYDCTHCFNCIEACPKGVAPMNQIMRLRRIAGSDHGIDDRNNGHRHEAAFVKNIQRNGILHEADLLPDSYGGKFHPRAAPELLSSLPVITKALLRRKVTLGKALRHQHKAPADVKAIFEKIESKDERLEFNLYISGRDEDTAETAGTSEAHTIPSPGTPGTEASTASGQAGDERAFITKEPEPEPLVEPEPGPAADDDDDPQTTSQPDADAQVEHDELDDVAHGAGEPDMTDEAQAATDAAEGDPAPDADADAADTDPSDDAEQEDQTA